jgi:hypothetical protein
VPGETAGRAVRARSGEQPDYDRDEVHQLAGTKRVEHTLHGSIHMTSGCPDDTSPLSYASVSQVKELSAAISADLQAMADSMFDGGFIVAGTPEDCEPVLAPSAKSASTRSLFTPCAAACYNSKCLLYINLLRLSGQATVRA